MTDDRQDRTGREAAVRLQLQHNRRSRSGFTLLELSVAVTILVGLSGIAVAVFSSAESAKAERARLDCKTIADALAAYIKDVRLRPTSAGGGPGFWLLSGSLGQAPQNSLMTPAEMTQFGAGLDAITRVNTWNSFRWRGPYLREVPPDPWGQCYVVWARSFHESGARVWVLSAGNDGVLNTNWNSTSVQGDDVGIPME